MRTAVGVHFRLKLVAAFEHNRRADSDAGHIKLEQAKTRLEPAGHWLASFRRGHTLLIYSKRGCVVPFSKLREVLPAVGDKLKELDISRYDKMKRRMCLCWIQALASMSF